MAPNGRVDIAWHDFRDDLLDEPGSFRESGPEEERWTHVYYSFSTIRGRTWSPDVRVFDPVIDRDFGATFESGYRGSLGVAVADPAVYVVRPDTREDDPDTAVEDVYAICIPHTDGAALATTSGGGVGPLLAGAVGAGVALVVAGLVPPVAVDG